MAGKTNLFQMANYHQHGYPPTAKYNNFNHMQFDSGYSSASSEYESYNSAPQFNYQQQNHYNQYPGPGSGFHGQPGYHQHYQHNQGYYDYNQNYGYGYPPNMGAHRFPHPTRPPMVPGRDGMPYNPNLPMPGKKRKLPDKDVKKQAHVTAKEAFPVSCGTQHKKEAEGYVPKRIPIPPEVMSRMALAKARIEANPRDPEAQSQLTAAMMEYHMYQDGRNTALQNDADNARRKTGYEGPGLFTGQALIEPMSRDELDSDDIRTFASPDMFKNLKPLRENFGKFIMRKFGWKEGKPLGTTGAGSLAPIEITVKIDRKGLMNDREFMKKKPEGLAKNEGPNWICKIVNTKNPVCGISEMHQALGLPTPVFKLVSEDDGVFKWNVSTNWGCFAPFKGTKSKKQAKSECAYRAIKEILRIESEHKGVEPPSEAEESCFLRCIFIPSNKTAAGNKMLYKHFYSGGQLTNVLEPPGFTPDIHNYHNEPWSEPAEPSTSSYHSNHTSYDVVKPAHLNTTKKPKILTGADWMLDSINGKNASAALFELCVAANKPHPDEYSQYIKGEHAITITTPWGMFSHSERQKSRSEVRKIACYNAIKEILKKEAAKFNCKPPVELAESDENNLSFAPDPC